MPTRTHKMNLFGSISYVINGIVGSGIFITSPMIYKNANSVNYLKLIDFTLLFVGWSFFVDLACFCPDLNARGILFH